MKSTHYAVVLLLFIAYTGNSCNKIKDYFREPETDVLVETLHSTTLTGYAANIAMSVMEGQTFQQVVTIRNGEGFPCTTLMEVDLRQTSFGYTSDKAGAVTIAGLWPDANTAILSLIYTDYEVGTNTLDIVGIETIPVLRDGNYIHVVMASQDIQLNPEQQALLSIDLNTFQIESELFRLDMPHPNDVYVALVQNAYFIDINNNGTIADLDDDTYTVTGGGQLVEIDGNDAEIIQQAMVDVRVSPTCQLNPLNGMALIKVTGLEDSGFPELGTAVIEFSDRCNGSAHVFAATGMYIGANGSKVSFLL
jgi:hypothetical protein